MAVNAALLLRMGWSAASVRLIVSGVSVAALSLVMFEVARRRGVELRFDCPHEIKPLFLHAVTGAIVAAAMSVVIAIGFT